MTASNVVEFSAVRPKAAANLDTLKEAICLVEVAQSEVRIYLAMTDEGSYQHAEEVDFQRQLTRVVSAIEAAAWRCNELDTAIQGKAADEMCQLYSAAAMTITAATEGDCPDGNGLCDPVMNVMELFERELHGVRAELVRRRRELRAKP